MRMLAVAPALLLSLSLAAGSAHAQSPDVRVINVPEDPVNTAHLSDNLPFVMTRTINGEAGAQSFVSDLFFENLVPQGFRFIVTQINLNIQVSPGIRVSVVAFIGDVTGQAGWRIPLPLLSQMTWSVPTPVPGFPGLTTWVPKWDFLTGDSPVHFALDPGDGVGVSVVKSTSTGSTFGWITFQGHLVPIGRTSGE